ncbi:MAG: alanine--glyoxylate aminotransferase family protein [Clostridiales bacterium]|nr:alanine--glyoxylate aminotransferase family protein [Clostridiales bacterium]
MTPGPVQVRENVRNARSIKTTNPDVDTSFVEEYKETCDKIAKILHTSGNVYILSGEGILGLECACASLTEKGDRVLVIDNGIYGNGFADFVSLYGGNPVLYQKDYRHTIDVEELRAYLENDHDFKYATVVHNDTPSGMTNDVMAIGRLLDEFGILSVVDSVSGMIGEELNIDEGKLDIVCGGSQKAISAPVGLTFVTVSDRAIKAMEERKSKIASFYCNLLNFKTYYEDKWFPYTMPISDIYGLSIALDNILEEKDIVGRHARIAKAVRTALVRGGLTLYAENGFSNNVTVFYIPEGITERQILDTMKEKFGILLSGSFGVFAGKVIRIGHMGENANKEDVVETLEALYQTLSEYSVPLKEDFAQVFQEEYEKE